MATAALQPKNACEVIEGERIICDENVPLRGSGCAVCQLEDTVIAGFSCDIPRESCVLTGHYIPQRQSRGWDCSEEYDVEPHMSNDKVT